MARRAENFATLAANATERVVRIIHGNTVFALRAPIDLDVRDDSSYCLVEYEPLGLHGRGRDQAEALESFADQFWGMWEWIASADDPKLTEDARRLKRKMLSLVRSVTPAA
jgi:hypothetical protein